MKDQIQEQIAVQGRIREQIGEANRRIDYISTLMTAEDGSTARQMQALKAVQDAMDKLSTATALRSQELTDLYRSLP